MLLIKKTVIRLTCILLLGVTIAGVAHAAVTNVVKGADGEVDLHASNVCVSEAGLSFTRRYGGACQAGDLAYINLAFDSDAAANVAQIYCDFDKERPSQAMDIYGVLCYLRIKPPGVSK